MNLLTIGIKPYGYALNPPKGDFRNGIRTPCILNLPIALNVLKVPLEGFRGREIRGIGKIMLTIGIKPYGYGI